MEGRIWGLGLAVSGCGVQGLAFRGWSLGVEGERSSMLGGRPGT